LVESERSGGKFITIRIQRSTYQQLKDMAGADLPPEIYLQNIIAQIATGTSLEILTPASTAIHSLTEITGKLAVLSECLQRLTELTQENRRAIESLRVNISPLPTGRFDTIRSDIKSPDKLAKPVEPHQPSWDKAQYSPQFQNNGNFPIIPPAEVYDEGGEDDAESLEAKIKQYEKDNPW
jgi:hypothetical protein